MFWTSCCVIYVLKLLYSQEIVYQQVGNIGEQHLCTSICSSSNNANLSYYHDCFNIANNKDTGNCLKYFLHGLHCLSMTKEDTGAFWPITGFCYFLHGLHCLSVTKEDNRSFLSHNWILLFSSWIALFVCNQGRYRNFLAHNWILLNPPFERLL